MDPYEHGFEVAKRRRLDLPDLDAPLPDGPRVRRPPRISWRWLLALLAVVLLLAIGRSLTARNATSLQPDCSRLQIGLGETSVRTHGPQLLHWAVTAPAGTRFVVTVNPGGARSQTSGVQTMGHGCLARGEFGVLVPPGRYPVALFRTGAGTPAATRTVTVTAS